MEESSQGQDLTSIVRRSLQLLILFSILYGVPIPSKSQFFTELFWLLSRTLERKYMFLLCNGILAFLAKKSSSSSALIGDDVDEVTSPSFEALEDDILLVDEDNQVKREELSLLEPPPKKVEEREEETTYVKGLEGEVSIKKDDVKQREKEEERVFTVKQEREEYGGGEAPSMEANEELVSTEELNRKFEEFIRKMKEEMRIEAQQQLIAV
ncbi:hypothetical protein K2173_001041 [Erythroxylum novogranatense]|uniref:Uncharacterized protein n=1 Tax=Erythroxylum novogranatense TaxID=1862640 RepID=A0AAV8SJ04_9ROSI|nr:hypothetical protein K2173_001041 [Erythroxylum novogranatense]